MCLPLDGKLNHSPMHCIRCCPNIKEPTPRGENIRVDWQNSQDFNPSHQYITNQEIPYISERNCLRPTLCQTLHHCFHEPQTLPSDWNIHSMLHMASVTSKRIPCNEIKIRTLNIPLCCKISLTKIRLAFKNFGQRLKILICHNIKISNYCYSISCISCEPNEMSIGMWTIRSFRPVIMSLDQL